MLVTLLISILFLISIPTPGQSQIDPASEWHFLYIKIRDRIITKEEALNKLKELEALLKDFYFKKLGQKIR